MKAKIKLLLTITIIHFGSEQTIRAISELPPYLQNFPIKKQNNLPMTITSGDIEQQKQQLTELRKQLLEMHSKNPRIKALLEQKKAINQEIRRYGSMLQAKQQDPKVRALLTKYYAAQKDNNVPFTLKNQFNTVSKNIQNIKQNFNAARNKLTLLKKTLHERYPRRNELLKKIKDAQVKDAQLRSLQTNQS